MSLGHYCNGEHAVAYRVILPFHFKRWKISRFLNGVVNIIYQNDGKKGICISYQNIDFVNHDCISFNDLQHIRNHNRCLMVNIHLALINVWRI